jgi:F-type H+-transporting ATPase subunit b
MRKLAAILALLFPKIVLASGGGGHGGGELSINWWHWDMHQPPLGWLIVDFLIFAFLLVRFTKGPITKALQSRHDTIKKTVADNDAAFATAKAKYEEARDKLQRVEREVTDLIAKLKEEGGVERDRIVQNARSYAERLKADSQVLIELEAKSTRERLRNAVALDVLSQAEQLIAKELTDKDRDRLVDNALAELEDSETHVTPLKRRAPAERKKAAGESGDAA